MKTPTEADKYGEVGKSPLYKFMTSFIKWVGIIVTGTVLSAFIYAIAWGKMMKWGWM